jgi:hypothetical protein
MENTTKILITKSGNLISNVLQFPNQVKQRASEETETFIYVEFPYKHLLPKLEAA